MTRRECGCTPDEDGVFHTAADLCENHRYRAWNAEHSARKALDLEQDARFAAQFGKRNDLLRAEGALANFEVKR